MNDVLNDPCTSLLTDADREYLQHLFGDRVAFDAPLAPFTSWKIGGPADALVTVQSSDELAALLHVIQQRRLPWMTLGSGSNILIGDGGIRGVIVRLGAAFTTLEFDESDAQHVVVKAGASASLSLLCAQAASRGARDIDALAGIPGSVGGALRMNAGTNREIGDFVQAVWVQTPLRPEPHAVTPQYYYRHTTLERDAIVTLVTLAFEHADVADVRATMQARLVRRKSTQPLQWPNAGSCFRNPPGDKAGRLIEAIGAKGRRIGDAQISELHANFIVNLGNARAADVASLLASVRREVAERFQVELELEVHFVGVFV